MVEWLNSRFLIVVAYYGIIIDSRAQETRSLTRIPHPQNIEL